MVSRRSLAQEKLGAEQARTLIHFLTSLLVSFFGLTTRC